MLLQLEQTVKKYPYELDINPFSHVPTPSLTAAKVLGGQKWKEIKKGILICVDELKETLKREKEGFSIISIEGPLGTGKTHLALHMETIKNDFKCIYLDLTRIEPKNFQSIYLAIVKALNDVFFQELRKNLIFMISENAKKGNDYASRTIKISIIDKILRRKSKDIAIDIINNRRGLNLKFLKNAMSELIDNNIFQSAYHLISENFEWFYQINDFNEALNKFRGLTGISSIFGKVILLEIDEITVTEPLMEALKIIINDKPRGIILMTILKTEIDKEIEEVDPSLADRLQKAPFTFSLSQPDNPDEFWDIIREYLKFYNAKISEEQGESFKNLLKYTYNELGISKIRNVLALMREVMEIGKGSEQLQEEHFIEAIIRIRPSAELKDTIMHIPIPDYLRILKTNMESIEVTLDNLIGAIRDLGYYLFMKDHVFYSHRASKRIDTPGGIRSYRLADIYLEEKDGKKIVFSVKLSKKDCLTKQDIEDSVDIVEYGKIDQAIILTNVAHSKEVEHPKLIFTTISDNKNIADYLYFSEKFRDGKLSDDDEQNAIKLAKYLGI